MDWYDLYIFSHHRLKTHLELFQEKFIDDSELKFGGIEECHIKSDEEGDVEWKRFSSKEEALDFGLENVLDSFSIYFDGRASDFFNTVIVAFTLDGGIVYGFSIPEDRYWEVHSSGELASFVDVVKNMVKGVSHLVEAVLPPPDHFREFEKEGFAIC